MDNAISIVLLGQKFTINCPSGEETNLRAVAANLDQTMQAVKERTHIHNREQLTVMAALQIGFELHKEKTYNQQQSQLLDERIKKLQLTLENALVSRSHTE